MSRISNVKTIYEFTNNDFGTICGLYQVIFNGKEEIFIRNNDSVGVVAHYVGEPASKCVSDIRDDVRDEFLDLLKT